MNTVILPLAIRRKQEAYKCFIGFILAQKYRVSEFGADLSNGITLSIQHITVNKQLSTFAGMKRIEYLGTYKLILYIFSQNGTTIKL